MSSNTTSTRKPAAGSPSTSAKTKPLTKWLLMRNGMSRKGRRKMMTDSPTSLRVRYNDIIEEQFRAIAKLEKTRFEWSRNELNDRIKELQIQARKLDQQINNLTEFGAELLNDARVLK